MVISALFDRAQLYSTVTTINFTHACIYLFFLKILFIIVRGAICWQGCSQREVDVVRCVVGYSISAILFSYKITGLFHRADIFRSGEPRVDFSGLEKRKK